MSRVCPDCAGPGPTKIFCPVCEDFHAPDPDLESPWQCRVAPRGLDPLPGRFDLIPGDRPIPPGIRKTEGLVRLLRSLEKDEVAVELNPILG